MGTAAAPLLSRTFPISSKVLAPGSAASITLGPRTADVIIQAVLSSDGVLPPGDLSITDFDVQLAGGNLPEIRLGSAASTVRLGFSADASAKLGVFDSQDSLLQALALKDADELRLDLDGPDTRLVLLRAGYSLSADASGSHPVGALGTISFGASGNRGQVFAVVNRISPETPARQALTDIALSLRLPRQVDKIDDLRPGSIILAETEGGFALNLAAQLGYDFSFIREIQGGGLSGDIGLRLETGLKATLGFQADGRFLVTVDRPSLDASVKNVRVRLFKLAKRGWSFGFNLNVGVQGETQGVPERFDDLVKGVFGTHGAQVIEDLKVLEKWTSPDQDLSELAAGLTTDSAFRLIKESTGVDPETAFDEGREQLLSALRAFDELPTEVAAQLQSVLERAGLSAAERKRFEAALTAIASESDEGRKAFVDKIVGEVGFDSTPIGQWLRAAASDGLLSVLERTAVLRKPAEQTLAVLDGQVFEKALGFMNSALNLDQIEGAVTKTDFNKIDSWLKARISRFLDEDFAFEKLDEVKNAINRLIEKRQQIYAKALQALSKRYDFSYAYEYERTTTKTALLDATFNMAQAQARAQLKAVLQKGNYDEVFVNQAKGVSIGQAVMTHQISRKQRVAINMPFWQRDQASFLTSDASVEAVNDGGRVLVYELKTDNTVNVGQRMRSQLSVAGGVNLALGADVRRFSGAAGTWSYQFREARADVKAREFERRVAPFLRTYFADSFGGEGQGTVSDWVAELDRRAEAVNGSSPNRVGDVLVSVDLSLPGEALGAWFQKFDSADLRKAAKLAMSLRLQAALKFLLPFGYLQDTKHLRRNDTLGALLVWSSIPPANSVRVKGGDIVPTGKGVYWDFVSPTLREVMVGSSDTQTALTAKVTDIHERLLDAGENGPAKFFEPTPGNVEALMTAVESDAGPAKLDSLLRFEAQMVTRAASALDQIAKFQSNAGTMPAKSIATLADFGADLTDTFNKRLTPLYGGDSARVLGSMLFLEATRALNPDLAHTLPTALFAVSVLKPASGFDVGSFAAGAAPTPAEIALSDRLLSAAAAER